MVLWRDRFGPIPEEASAEVGAFPPRHQPHWSCDLAKRYGVTLRLAIEI
jgi:hypothetical protein